MLEDRLTEKAAGSLERLFATVPSQATLVEVEGSGRPRAASAKQVRPTDSMVSNILCWAHTLSDACSLVPCSLIVVCSV